MNRSCFRLNLTVLAVIATLLLGALSLGIAQDTTSTFSGRVVDADGNPVAGVLIGLRPARIINNSENVRRVLRRPRNISDARRMRNIFDATRLNPWNQLQTDETDKAGQFSITDVASGPSEVVVISETQTQIQRRPHFEPDYEILSLKIGKMTFHPDIPFGFRRTPFSIEPGAHIENVEVAARPRMRIRGRVVFADGTPLANEQIRVNMQRRDFNGSGTGTSSGSTRTDNAGYFVEYVSNPGFYTVVVNFRRRSAKSDRLRLEARQRLDDLVLTFGSNPIPIDSLFPGDKEAWMVNPANGHIYKRVHCTNWEDAQAKAVAEDAHLVAINDAAEQKWLSEIFGIHPYWIGLTDVAKEGEWQWTSGEPVTYTNWTSHRAFSGRGEEDYVFMGLSPDGEWHSVDPENPRWRMPQMAIIEKDSAPAKTPVKKK
jgi:hypothetical protein